MARAAWAVILSTRRRMPGSKKDVCFAATLSGRTAPLAGLEDMMGSTITTMPLRIALDLDQPIYHYLQQVQEQAISMLSFEYLGLSQIRLLSNAAQNACNCSNLLIVQPAQLRREVLPLGMTRIMFDEAGLIETFGLVIECNQSQLRDSKAWSASYDSSRMTKQEVRHLLKQFFRMITELSSRCNLNSPLRSALWSLTDENDFQQMVKWNRNFQSTPLACLNELIEKSAKCHPNRLAILANDGELKYGELDAAADTCDNPIEDEEPFFMTNTEKTIEKA